MQEVCMGPQICRRCAWGHIYAGGVHGFADMQEVCMGPQICRRFAWVHRYAGGVHGSTYMQEGPQICRRCAWGHTIGVQQFQQIYICSEGVSVI